MGNQTYFQTIAKVLAEDKPHTQTILAKDKPHLKATLGDKPPLQNHTHGMHWLLELLFLNK